ncbi:MAG: hypothetical protein ACYS67_05725 [Planctomycetota bacterium]
MSARIQADTTAVGTNPSGNVATSEKPAIASEFYNSRRGDSYIGHKLQVLTGLKDGTAPVGILVKIPVIEFFFGVVSMRYI